MCLSSMSLSNKHVSGLPSIKVVICYSPVLVYWFVTTVLFLICYGGSIFPPPLVSSITGPLF